eukprot:6195129-Pleurochrysis_carterae.AAC.2
MFATSSPSAHTSSRLCARVPGAYTIAAARLACLQPVALRRSVASALTLDAYGRYGQVKSERRNVTIDLKQAQKLVEDMDVPKLFFRMTQLDVSRNCCLAAVLNLQAPVPPYCYSIFSRLGT